MDLSDAFRGFDPVLHDLLRNAAAREDHDALALGELEATKQNAAARMSEIETVLKQAADEGKVSHVRLPAFERGFRSRVGRDLAESVFQQKLAQQLPDAMRIEGRTDPEKIIGDTYAEVSQQIHSDDFYARQAFDATAQGVIAAFRQRAAEGYTAEYQRAAEQRIADEGSELVLQLASADADSVPALRESVKVHLDEIRKELPKSEVNGFFVQRVIAPAVERLVSDRKFPEARQLLDQMDNVDVTGKGGLLSQTAAAKVVFSNLRASIEREDRATASEDFDRHAKAETDAVRTGREAAAKAVYSLKQKLNGGPLPTSEIPGLLAEGRALGNGTASETYEATIRAAFDDDDKWRRDERATARLLSEINTLAPDRLDAKAAQLETMMDAKEISADGYYQAKQAIEQNRKLYRQVQESDVHDFVKAVFEYPTGNPSYPRSLNVDDDAALTIWQDKLSEESRTNVRVAASDFFAEQLRQQIRNLSGGNPDQVPAIKSQAWDKASTAARVFTKSAIRGALKAQQTQDTAAKVATHAATIRQVKAYIPSRGALSDFLDPWHNNDDFFKRNYTVTDRAPKGIKNPPEHEQVFVPRPSEDIAKEIEAQKTTPMSEWDVVATPSYFRSTLKAQHWQGLPQVLDLAALAKEATATGDKTSDLGNPGRAAAALRYYGFAKSLLGFTPEEIKTGKTKHGVAFDPAQIDYKTIPVFRSVAELEKEWNKGDFTPLFGEVGDLVDPKNKVHAQDFYLAQLALLSARK